MSEDQTMLTSCNSVQIDHAYFFLVVASWEGIGIKQMWLQENICTTVSGNCIVF